MSAITFPSSAQAAVLTSYEHAISTLTDFIGQPVQHGPSVGLTRCALLLESVGNPQVAFDGIHVTGTVGKGSTTAFAASILRAAGHKVGHFTSPHLVDYTERIAIDGTPISRADWVTYQQRVWPYARALSEQSRVGQSAYTFGRPSFLEILWTMACLYFRDQGVDCAVIEVGMGGRFDPTTVNATQVAVITTIGLDHLPQLGPTTRHIAAHKAGVIKPHGIAVTAAPRVPRQVIADEAIRQQAELWHVGTRSPADVRYRTRADRLHVATPVTSYANLTVGLPGNHQHVNAALAVAAVDAYGQRSHRAIPAAAVAQGIASTRLPGRLELLRPAVGPEIVLDGAKSPVAARALGQALPQVLGGRPMTLLLGILRDKNTRAMVPSLVRHAAAVVVTEPPGTHRTGAAAEIAALARAAQPAIPIWQDDEYAQAFARARHLTPPHGVVVVAGSLYLVGAIRALLAQEGIVEGDG